MIRMRSGFVTQSQNELKDFEAELLSMVCSDVEIESAFQDISGEQLERSSNRAPGVRLDIHSRELWGNQRSAFIEVKVFKLILIGIFTTIMKIKKKRLYSTRGLDKELSHLLFSHQRAVWERSAYSIIADQHN